MDVLDMYDAAWITWGRENLEPEQFARLQEFIEQERQQRQRTEMATALLAAMTGLIDREGRRA